MSESILDIWNSAPKGDDLLKSMQDMKETKTEPKSAIIDPTSSVGIMGVRQKPATIPFSTLRRMAQVPAISAIILTRLNQMARYSKRPRFDGDLGFELRLKDRQAKMTDAARKEAMKIEDFFLRTGGIGNLKRKDNFNQYLRKIGRDTLILDAMVWENVPNLKGGLAEVWAVDATTIELVSNAPVGEGAVLPVYIPQTKGGMKISGEIAYVQRMNGQIVAEYTEDQLAYAIRNPRTDIDFTDFGMSELETLIEIVTGIMNGVRYNTSYFSHSHLPQGVLEIVGKYKDEHFQAFKRHWKNLTSGAAGKWATPIMGLEEGNGFKFTPFKNSNRDMEFNEFLEFLFNIACAVYQIDPNEVGFKSWTSSTSMSSSDNTEAKMEGSKDKGFVPLMNFMSDTFNSEIVDRINEEFEFRWVGVDEEDEDKKLDREEKQVGIGMKTISMLWAENDMDVEDIKKQNGGELPKWAYAPANAQLIQVYMAESGLQQQGDQQGSEDDPNAEADQQQAQADDQHDKQLETSDDSHDKELEKMDKEHDQSKEMEQVKHKNALEIEKVKAKSAPKPTAAKGKLQKSMNDTEDGSVEIEITWDGY